MNYLSNNKKIMFMWGVQHPDGYINCWSVKPTRVQSMEWLTSGHYGVDPSSNWRWWYNRGWRAVKVEVRLMPHYAPIDSCYHENLSF